MYGWPTERFYTKISKTGFRNKIAFSKFCSVNKRQVLCLYRLRVATQDAKQLKTARTALEKQVRELQAKCSHLEEEKYDAIVKVRDSMQLLEEANLQKNQVRYRIQNFPDY